MKAPPPKLSNDELQAQREAIRRGLLRANTAAVLILLLVIGLALAAVLEATGAGRERARAIPAEAEAVIPPVVFQGGTYSFVVVANGIALDPVTLPQPVWVDFNYLGGTQNGTYNFPFKRLTNGISAVAANGIIFIKSAGHSAETNRITKAGNWRPRFVRTAPNPATDTEQRLEGSTPRFFGNIYSAVALAAAEASFPFPLCLVVM